ncbi:MAG: SGNH/GDSL hydrolase family protein, partial [Deltaproteobacteria bacterium]
MRNKFRTDAVPWVPVAPTKLVKNVLPGIQGRVEFSVNSYGLRGPNTDLRKNDINFLVIGGSTSECKYVTDKLSWPWRFQDSLARKLNKRIFVGNAGRSGHFLLHHIYLLQHYKYAPDFDWIIFLVSGNDIRPLVLNNYEKEKEAVPYWTLTSFEASAEPNVPYYGKSRILKGIKTYLLIHNWFPNTIKEDVSGMEIVKKRALRKNALKKNALRKLPSSSEIEKAI